MDSGCGNGYTLHVNAACNGKRYTLHARRWLLIVFEKSYVKNGMPEKS
jgi:hypothetical protein